MPGRFLRGLVALFAVGLAFPASAAAAVVTFDGHVLRYRAHPREQTGVAVRGELSAPPQPPYLQIFFVSISIGIPIGSVHLGSGCQNYGSGAPDPRDDTIVQVRCPLLSVPRDKLRYRFTLGDSLLSLEGLHSVRGVVYGRSGDDDVSDGDRVYGGPGQDALTGARVYGGPGEDIVSGDTATTDKPVVHGGRGNDDVGSPGLLYGGPGNDELADALFTRSADMLVGGPGRDTVYLDRDGRSDVVRVRGGGVDRVSCRERPDAGDALFVDRSDRVDADCRGVHVLLTGRPRYPYP